MRKHLSATSAKLVATVAGCCALALSTVVACQSAPTAQPTSGRSAFPVAVHERDGTTVTISHQPRRIVSLSPTATEMLFAVGAGKQVVAVDDQSNYPTNAPTTKLSGIEPNVEAIAGYSPDLVVAADDTTGLAKRLASLSVPMVVEPAARTLDDSYALG